MCVNFREDVGHQLIDSFLILRAGLEYADTWDSCLNLFLSHCRYKVTLGAYKSDRDLSKVEVCGKLIVLLLCINKSLRLRHFVENEDTLSTLLNDFLVVSPHLVPNFNAQLLSSVFRNEVDA